MQSDAWRNEVLPVDAWRRPESEWDVEVMLDVLASLSCVQGTGATVTPLIQRITAPGSVHEVDQVRVDAEGALRRPPGAVMGSDLLGWVVACVWGESGVRQRLLEGCTVVRVRSAERGAEGHVCVPMRPGVDGQTLIACSIGAQSTDAVLRVASQLTLLTYLLPESDTHLQDAAADVGAAVSPPVMELTPRQREILRGMAQGMTNRQIAARIAFSESTVRLESLAIYRFFGVHSRFQAVAAAREAGVLRERVLSVGA